MYYKQKKMKHFLNFCKKAKKFFESKKTKEQKRIPELDEAIEDYKNGNITAYNSMEEFKARMAED